MPGIYLHIPFCRQACHYCNFHFSVSHEKMPEMVAAITKEARLQKAFLKGQVDTIYFGGGTPSLLPGDHLQEILSVLKEHYTISEDAEITLETNPDDINPDSVLHWKQAGINRLSIGIQSFSDTDLQWMNRAHTAGQAETSIELAKQAGFQNITIDLIYGTPGLSDNQWQLNLQKAIDFQIPHISCYALTVEPNTALANHIDKKKSADVDPDTQARHFSILTQSMQHAGYEHYEISNFARPGFRSRHNSSYWQGQTYLGLGPSAHSFNGTRRQWNISNNSLYLQSLQQDLIPFESEDLTTIQMFNEFIMIRLRTLEGISLTELTENFDGEKTETLIQAARKYVVTGHLLMSDSHIRLSESGKFLADGIAADLFLG